MGTLFRSEDMTLCQLFLQSESAYGCVSELGELGAVQFRDLNPDQNPFQRKYVSEIRRCDEMQRRLRFLENEAKKDKVPIMDTGANPLAPPPPEMVDLETTLEKLESDLKEVNQNFVQLKKNDCELKELKYILQKAQSFFDEKPEDMFFEEAVNEEIDGNEILLDDDKRVQTQREGLGFFAGVITRDRMPGFERLLWRACRGTAFLRQSEIEDGLEDPKTGEKVNKCVVIIFYQGERLKTRVRKICDAFHVTIYPCPESESERREMSIGVTTRIDDLNIVINQTKEHRQKIIFSASQNLREWTIKICKIKAIYHTLNMFNVDVTNKCLIGECWCAVDDIDAIQSALHRGGEITESSTDAILNRIHFSESPPTYNRVNKLTRGFQNIVNAYGVADYQEANPAPFMVITFPFLFGVMFGDSGHGLVMFLFGLWMVVFEKYYQRNMRGGNEIWKTFFGGRYIILLMGAFAMYSGLLYNDCFSRAFNIFGSSWHSNYTASTLHTTPVLQLNPAHDLMYTGKPYPFGEDPAWQSALNKISFTNSLKMKLSVVLGVSQMMFGVCLSCTNYVYFKNKLNIYCQFIPQVLFLGCIFVYLSFLFFYKWIAYNANQSGCAPSLLIALINMFMFKYPSGPDVPCNEHPIYAGQSGVQSVLVVIAVICVPWMLFVKPAILYYRHKKEVEKQEKRPESDVESDHSDQSDLSDLSDRSGTEGALLKKDVQEFNFGDICVHQIIHTIEYCLGCISNTASYLRLWALSLAHSELTEVLWMMVLKIGLKQNGYQGCIMLFLVFAFWETLTIAILLLMEGLSAFLHALRLHWVEFQNKFYIGSGYMFMPFSFEALLAADDDE